MGDCVDRKQVAVCPMGIDIRDGQQLECIHRAPVPMPVMRMAKVDRPRADRRRHAGQPRPPESRADGLPPASAKTVIYTLLTVLVPVGLMLGLLVTRDAEVNAARICNPFFVQLADGLIRNGYTIKILNKRHDASRFELSVEQAGRRRGSGDRRRKLDMFGPRVGSGHLGKLRVPDRSCRYRRLPHLSTSWLPKSACRPNRYAAHRSNDNVSSEDRNDGGDTRYTDTDYADDGFRLTGRHILFAMLAFFGLVIAVNIVFVNLALTLSA